MKDYNILVHNYQPPKIQDIGDYVGDTLKLCKIANNIEDYNKALSEYLENNTKPDLILTTDKPFNALKKDLVGHSIFELFDNYNVPIIPIPETEVLPK